ncbi:hypothetical protein CDAR_29931 [Caerostris darwini]|uniref:Uncharacterized protein n=1 Tax=Caerostris darwini TaxID=1538125 RepID=A0AAV4V1X1_9ARAC|nr:hypothetical protein CDAR_29931 [Caerostris darwini]
MAFSSSLASPVISRDLASTLPRREKAPNSGRTKGRQIQYKNLAAKKSRDARKARESAEGMLPGKREPGPQDSSLREEAHSLRQMLMHKSRGLQTTARQCRQSGPRQRIVYCCCNNLDKQTH